MTQMDTLFMTKQAKKWTIPFGAANIYIVHIREYLTRLVASLSSWAPMSFYARSVWKSRGWGETRRNVSVAPMSRPNPF